MANQSFENLEVWCRGCRLSVRVFELFKNCKFPSLQQQAERSGLSIPSNIAEGAERGGAREFSQFLKVAKGSAGELRTQLYIATKLKILDTKTSKSLIAETKEISAMLEGLRKSILRPRTEEVPPLKT